MVDAGIRRVLAVVAVVFAASSAAVGALALFEIERDLSVGKVRLSSAPAWDGALDVYVPLVDWGVRFPEAVRMPARLSLNLRTVDRSAAERLADGDAPEVGHVRDEAAQAVADYVRLLVVAIAIAAVLLGGLVAVALRGDAARPRTLAIAVAGTAIAWCSAVAVLLPPRGEIANPDYYAHGPDIPAALRAVELARGSADALSEEIGAQLVGLARLVTGPADRAGAGSVARLTLASDLHSNLLALPALERAAAGGPLFFAGDLTSSGSPFETALTRRVARIGSPTVFVSGNHDSDVLARRLARAGAIVLTDRGRLRADGTRGPLVVRVGRLRVAGYPDPFERRAVQGYRDRYRDAPPPARRRRDFADWLRPLVGDVDIVMVHSPGLAARSVRELRADPPASPLVILTGHTHRAAVRTSSNLVVLNGGTAGGGGIGNLDENQPFGLAVLTYARDGGFRPLLADTVEIDPRDGAASAERTPLAISGDAARAPVRRTAGGS